MGNLLINSCKKRASAPIIHPGVYGGGYGGGLGGYGGGGLGGYGGGYSGRYGSSLAGYNDIGNQDLTQRQYNYGDYSDYGDYVGGDYSQYGGVAVVRGQRNRLTGGGGRNRYEAATNSVNSVDYGDYTAGGGSDATQINSNSERGFSGLEAGVEAVQNGFNNIGVSGQRRFRGGGLGGMRFRAGGLGLQGQGQALGGGLQGLQGGLGVQGLRFGGVQGLQSLQGGFGAAGLQAGRIGAGVNTLGK